MGYLLLLRGLGETDSWKNLKSTITWHCFFKAILMQICVRQECEQRLRYRDCCQLPSGLGLPSSEAYL